MPADHVLVPWAIHFCPLITMFFITCSIYDYWEPLQYKKSGQIYLQLRSCKNVFDHNIHRSFPIILKYRTEHSSYAAVLCVIF